MSLLTTTTFSDWSINSGPIDLGSFDANGQPIVVVVDESYFFHHKFHNGRRHQGNWVVGLVERATGKCWLEIVRRRDSAMLEQIIMAHVLPGYLELTHGEVT